MKQWQIDSIIKRYPPGTRIELISMEDSDTVPPGTKGSVTGVDAIGTVHMQWDNQRTLGLVPGVDHFRVISQEENTEQDSRMGGQCM